MSVNSNNNEGGILEDENLTGYNIKCGINIFGKISQNMKFISTQTHHSGNKWFVENKKNYDSINSGGHKNYNRKSPKNKIASDLRRNFLEFQKNTHFSNKLKSSNRTNRAHNTHHQLNYFHIDNQISSNFSTIDNITQKKYPLHDTDKYSKMYPTIKLNNIPNTPYNNQKIKSPIPEIKHFKTPSEIFQKPQSYQLSITKIGKNNTDRNMYKKLLKGRLLKIISESIVLKKDEIESYVTMKFNYINTNFNINRRQRKTTSQQKLNMIM